MDAARGEDRYLGYQSPNVALAGVRVIHCPQQVMNPIEIAKVLRLNFDLLRIDGQSTSNGRAHLLYLCENSAAEQLSQFAAKSSEQEADRQATDASVVKATSSPTPLGGPETARIDPLEALDRASGLESAAERNRLGSSLA